jgi:hypothetical protein
MGTSTRPDRKRGAELVHVYPVRKVERNSLFIREKEKKRRRRSALRVEAKIAELSKIKRKKANCCLRVRNCVWLDRPL